MDRGAAAHNLTKVKGQSTDQLVEQGLVLAEDKDGSDWADDFANRGASQHEPNALKLARWIVDRQATYAKFMTRLHEVMVTVIQAERAERAGRERRKKTQSLVQGIEVDKEMMATCTLPPHLVSEEPSNSRCYHPRLECIGWRRGKDITKLCIISFRREAEAQCK